MNASTSSRTGWFQMSLKTLFVFVMAVAAFFAGDGLAQRRSGKAVRDAQEAADVARQQEEQAERELKLERTKYGLLPPPVPDEALPERKVDGGRDWPAP